MSGIDAHPAGGGTWLGITKSGRLAAITNFTETAPPPLPQGRGLEAYRSRGSLVKDWLGRQGKADPDEIEFYLNSVASHMDEWPGFNLLVGQISKKATIGYVSNRSGKADSVYLESFIETGSGGLSNSCLQEPWNKVSMGKSRVDEALGRYDAHKGNQRVDQNAAEDQLMSELYEILEENVEITKRDDFKKSIQIPPLRLVNDAWYATRTATVLLVRRDGHVRWWEKDVYVLSPEEEPIKAEAMQLPPRYYEWQL